MEPAGHFSDVGMLEIAGYHDLLRRIELDEEEVVRLALAEGRGRRR